MIPETDSHSCVIKDWNVEEFPGNIQYFINYISRSSVIINHIYSYPLHVQSVRICNNDETSHDGKIK
jgi:hypothetical protein